MKIKAKNKYGRCVYIVQFVPMFDKLYAVTVDVTGNIARYPIEELTVVDINYKA